jgi:hypothetical protein
MGIAGRRIAMGGGSDVELLCRIYFLDILPPVLPIVAMRL